MTMSGLGLGIAIDRRVWARRVGRARVKSFVIDFFGDLVLRVMPRGMSLGKTKNVLKNFGCRWGNASALMFDSGPRLLAGHGGVIAYLLSGGLLLLHCCPLARDPKRR